ncbi:homeobox-leucine zipper protein ROC2-like [Impatiens glandulifera]|uniref:homeobox-leucine zipper protein ROC2-like n=1 Tax=Impatiens glandulifera TaxID=253017 RepID=UPI001FB1406F|nr:homeobox-leucine zipper protein ROC2-like [Impatiens glandulifera]
MLQKNINVLQDEELPMNMLYQQSPHISIFQEHDMQVNRNQQQNPQMSTFRQQNTNMLYEENSVRNIEHNPSAIRQTPVREGGNRRPERENDVVEAVETLGVDQINDTRKRKRKIFNRHTPQQIQVMERFFIKCPNPDEVQRRLLGQEIGMEPLQMINERNEVLKLSKSNERLKAENKIYKEALKNAICPLCGVPKSSENRSEILLAGHNLPAHNIEKSANIISRLKASRNIMPRQSLKMGLRNGVLNPTTSANEHRYPWGNQPDKDMIMYLAHLAMDELDKLAQIEHPMWFPNVVNSTGSKLNETEYNRVFASRLGPHIPTLKCESSRHTNNIFIDPLDLINIFLDMNQWKKFFHAIVAKAMTLEVWSTGTEENRDGALQAINVELHAPSPLVPTRGSMLARHCKQLGEKRWGIVDFSIDIVRPSDEIKYRKRPSGCIIDDLGNGVTRVTWIEHVEVDHSGVHALYKPLVNLGLAFGAKRWLGILGKQTDRLQYFLSTLVPSNDMVVTSVESKRCITRLAERMVESYSVAVSSAVDHPWSLVDPTAGPKETRILISRNTKNPGRPLGTMLSATNSFWLPAQSRNIFDYLKETRANWDLLSNGVNLEEISKIVIGQDKGSCISILQMNEEMIILQETNWDPLGAYLIFAPIDIQSMDMLMNGGDSENVAMLSSGFVVVPDGSTSNGSGGSLVTVSFQLLVDVCPTAILNEEYTQMVTNLLNRTINNMEAWFKN